MVFLYPMNKNLLLTIIEWAIRINVFVKLSIYGLGKIVGGQFYLKGELPEEVAKVSLADTTSYNLAWTFFGHSKAYIYFIGISQLIGALLFLINRTKLIGGAILIPILLNIIVVDYFFGVAYGAMFSACWYLASVLFVFYLYREQLEQAVKSLLKAPTHVIEKRKVWKLVLGIAAMFAVIFMIEYFGIAFFGYEDR